MGEKGRQPNHGINVLKFISVVLVILIHETFPDRMGIVAKNIAAMSVPVFFMISGYYSYGINIDKVKKRTLKMLKLTIIANLIYFVWDIAVEILSGASVRPWLIENFALKKWLVFLLTNESPLRGHLWFLGALLYAYLFLLVLYIYMNNGKGILAESIRKNQVKYLFVLSALLIVCNIAGGEFLTWYGKNIQIPYIRNWLFMGLPFFLLAYCIHAYKERIFCRIDSQKLWIALIFSIFLNIVEILSMTDSSLYITTVLVNITAFLIALGYKQISSPFLIVLGNAADKYGLWVYVLQIIVIKNLRWFYSVKGIADKAVIQYLSPFIALLLSFVLSIILVQISSVIKKRKAG